MYFTNWQVCYLIPTPFRVYEYFMSANPYLLSCSLANCLRSTLTMSALFRHIVCSSRLFPRWKTIDLFVRLKDHVTELGNFHRCSDILLL